MKLSYIISTGCYVPERKITNEYLTRYVKNFQPEKAKSSLSDWIKKHYGISERRWAKEKELPSDMATKAVQKALAKANLHAAELDFLILNTAYGDYSQPTTATAVQRKLGMREGSFAIELNMPCAGPIYGLVIGHNFIQTGQFKKGAVIGTDKMSELIDKEDFKMAGLFGDGAGACLLGESKNGGILSYHLGSKGEEGQEHDYALVIPGGRAANPTSAETLNKLHYLKMDGKKTANLFNTYMLNSIKELLKKKHFNIEDIDYMVSHQASRNLILGIAKEVGLPENKVLFTIKEFGNTSSASVFITLDKLFSQHIKAGSKLLIAGIGGGLNWGSILYETPS